MTMIKGDYRYENVCLLPNGVNDGVPGIAISPHLNKREIAVMRSIGSPRLAHLNKPPSFYYLDQGGLLQIMNFNRSSIAMRHRCNDVSLPKHIDPVIILLHTIRDTEDRKIAETALKKLISKGNEAHRSLAILEHISDNHSSREIEDMIKRTIKTIDPNGTVLMDMKVKKAMNIRYKYFPCLLNRSPKKSTFALACCYKSEFNETVAVEYRLGRDYTGYGAILSKSYERIYVPQKTQHSCSRFPDTISLNSQLKSPAKEDRIRALGQIKDLGSNAIILLPAVVLLLSDREWEVRKLACEIIAGLAQHATGQYISLGALLRPEHEKHPEVRIAAATALKKIAMIASDPDTLSSIIIFLNMAIKDPDQNVQTITRRLLEAIQRHQKKPTTQRTPASQAIR